MRDFPLHFEERVAVVRRMLNEQSLTVFPAMTEKQHAFVRRLMAVVEGDRRSVPRSMLMSVRVPRRFTPKKSRNTP